MLVPVLVATVRMRDMRMSRSRARKIVGPVLPAPEAEHAGVRPDPAADASYKRVTVALDGTVILRQWRRRGRRPAITAGIHSSA